MVIGEKANYRVKIDTRKPTTRKSRVSRGQAVIEVYVKELPDDVIRNLPTKLDGVSVEIVETGEIVAY